MIHANPDDEAIRQLCDERRAIGPQKAYKLFQLRKDGSLSPLFINASARLPIGVWMDAEYSHKRKGFAYRPGWHACFKPVAPHIKLNPKGKCPRVWAEVEVLGFEIHERPESQGGRWLTADRMKIVRLL